MQDLRELSGRFFEERPSLLAKFALPLGIEAGFAERLAKWRRIDVVEDQALGSEVALQRCVLSSDSSRSATAFLLIIVETLSFTSAGIPCHARRFTRNHQPSHM